MVEGMKRESQGRGSGDANRTAILTGHPVLAPAESTSVVSDRVMSAVVDPERVELFADQGVCTAVLAQRIGWRAPPPVYEGPPELTQWFEMMFRLPVNQERLAALVHNLYYDVLASPLFRNRTEGYLVQPPSGFEDEWDEAATRWLEDHFDKLEPQTPEDVGAALSNAAELLGDAHLIVYNTSTVFPLEATVGGEPLSLRAHRMALALDKRAEESDISIVDVDRVVAELGAAEHIVGQGVFSSEAAVIIAEEASELILDLPQIAPLIDSDVMQLALPRYDRRTDIGLIEKWHFEPGSAVGSGDVLFDLLFENLHWKVGGKQHDLSGRNLALSVVAMADGYIQEIVQKAGSTVEAGALVAVMSREDTHECGDVKSARPFPVGVRRREEATVTFEGSEM